MTRSEIADVCLDDRRPNRRCLVAGPKKRDGLIRFVVNPAGEVMPDILGRLPGRGFWLSADRDMVDKACAKRMFAKAARADVVVPGHLADDVERLLVRRCQEIIGLARRAKQAVFGYVQTRQWVERGEAAVLLAALDGSGDQRRKMRGSDGKVQVVDVLSAAELGGAVGRQRIVHGALAPGKLATSLRLEAKRLEGFRGLTTVAGGAAGQPRTDV